MSGLQDQVIPVHFGKGLDTKTDSKLVVAGKMLQLQDAVFTQIDQADKRNGYVMLPTAVLGGGSITSPKLLTSFQNELVCADSALGKILSLSTTQNVWVPKGNYVPVQLSNTVVSRYYANTTTVGHNSTTGAALGNIAAFGWITHNPGASNHLCPQSSVIDLSTGVALISDQFLSTAVSAIADAVVLGGSVLGVFYVNSGSLVLQTLNLSAGSASFNAPVTVFTDTISNTPFIVSTPTGAAIYYTNTSNVKLVTVDTTGTVLHTATVDSITTGYLSFSYISVDPTNSNIWVYYSISANTSSSASLSYAVYSSTLSVVLAATVIATTATISFGLVSVPVSTTQQTLLYAIAGLTTAQENLFSTNQVSIQSNGTVGAPSNFAQNVVPISGPLTLNGSQYIGVMYNSIVQGTYFFLNTSDGTILAKALPGAAEPHFLGWVSPCIQVSASKALVPVSAAYADIALNGQSTTLLTGSNYLTLDAGSSETYQALQANSNLILNGGQIYAYDGKSNTELGFHIFPCILSATPSASGGSIGTGTFQYFATYRYYDDQGNIYESEPSLSVSAVQASGSSNSCVLIISNLSMTSKQIVTGAVQIYVWRTIANGTNPVLIKQIVNNPGISTVTVTDTLADSALSGATPLYTTGGILPNQAPPAAVAMALHNNRLQLIPSENQAQVWYSQTLTPTAGINFSTDLVEDIDSVGGNCIGLAGMDDKLVIFAQNSPLYLSGDGAGPTGQGSTLTPAQPIPSDVGCSQSKGIIVFPRGIMFRTPKGIYLLDRSLGVSYIGMDVEKYNSQPITAATLLSTKSQIRFLTSSGLTLVYDYIFNQWSTFTNHQGYSSDIWQGTYVYARTDGSIFQESPGFYLDNATPFAPLAQTSHLALSSVQNFQRVKRFGMTGQYANGASASHGIQVSAAYDFSSSFSTPIPYLFGNANTSGPYQYRERLPRQKCDTISLLIQEITTGDSAELITFTDMSFDAGIKKGIRKMPTTASVG